MTVSNKRVIDRLKLFVYWHFSKTFLEFFHRLLNPDNIFKIESHNKQIKMYLPFKHDYIQAEIIVSRNFYEHLELSKIHDFISPGMIILDIGANIGNHTVYFSTILRAKKIYSFEPQRLVAAICKKNIELNNLSDIVKLFEFGLSENNSKASILFNGSSVNNSGATILKESEKGIIELKKLDSLNIPEKIDFIKVDIEGMEASFLLGAKNTILRDFPLIWIEILDHNYKNVNLILEGYGYKKIMEISGDNYLYGEGESCRQIERFKVKEK